MTACPVWYRLFERSPFRARISKNLLSCGRARLGPAALRPAPEAAWSRQREEIAPRTFGPSPRPTRPRHWLWNRHLGGVDQTRLSRGLHCGARSRSESTGPGQEEGGTSGSFHPIRSRLFGQVALFGCVFRPRILVLYVSPCKRKRKREDTSGGPASTFIGRLTAPA